MRIVYLGWGSLLWNFDSLSVKGTWKKATGLKLPIEYSRISDKGKGRITLVIDPVNGTDNTVWYIFSKNNLEKSIEKLKKREKTATHFIAYLDFVNERGRFLQSSNNSHHYLKKITEWAKKMKIDAVIWTDLPSNWKDIRKVNYSINDAYNYFEDASDEIQCKIIDYIEKSHDIGDINTTFSKFFIPKIYKKINNKIK